jgi:UDP-glucose:glycoprotein glucosyltransferase
MRQLTEPDFLGEVGSQQDLYTKSLQVIQSQGFVSPQALSTLKWSLAMHTTAPWIQAHYHLYDSTILPDRVSKGGFDSNCRVWVDWYDRQVCTVSKLEAIVAGGLSEFAKK